MKQKLIIVLSLAAMHCGLSIAGAAEGMFGNLWPTFAAVTNNAATTNSVAAAAGVPDQGTAADNGSATNPAATDQMPVKNNVIADNVVVKKTSVTGSKPAEGTPAPHQMNAKNNGTLAKAGTHATVDATPSTKTDMNADLPPRQSAAENKVPAKGMIANTTAAGKSQAKSNVTRTQAGTAKVAIAHAAAMQNQASPGSIPVRDIARANPATGIKAVHHARISTRKETAQSGVPEKGLFAAYKPSVKTVVAVNSTPESGSEAPGLPVIALPSMGQPAGARDVSQTAGLPMISPPSDDSSGASEVPAQEATPDAVTNLMYSLDDQYRLGPGDTIVYQVIEDQDAPTNLVITDSGDLEVPYYGLVHAGGKTCQELAEDIKSLLQKNLYYRATVVIALAIQNKNWVTGKVYVTGQVKNPGSYPIPSTENMTVSKAILAAGGFSDFSDQKHVRLIQKGANGNQTFIVNVVDVWKGDLSKDLQVQPGDTVVVPARLINY